MLTGKRDIRPELSIPTPAGRPSGHARRGPCDSGHRAGETEHFKRPVETPFTAEQRAHTVVLFGGLTYRHERLIEGLLRAQGHRAQRLPTPDRAALQVGRECGNVGQCNPTYFTVGNLLQFLHALLQNGMSRREVVEGYVFVTAGACGPCRFGMYEQEYRLALANAGFPGFRVIVFEQKGGFEQSSGTSGMRFDTEFFLGLLHSLAIGDMLGDLAYRIRPYEVVPGATDQALSDSVDEVSEFFHSRADKVWLDRFFGGPCEDPAGRLFNVVLWAGQLADRELGRVLGAAAARFSAIEVDYTRVLPLVKITGEFWAQLSEGEGNYGMFAFLEREGAEVSVEPIGNWLMYMLDQAKLKQRDRLGLSRFDPGSVAKIPGAVVQMRRYLRISRLALGERLFSLLWRRHRLALGSLSAPLSNQAVLRKTGHPYFHSRIKGGEGHMEVAKNILSFETHSAHMVLSLKPFGCMPSTQSDGVQAAVVNQHPGMVFLSVETAGDGEVNAHSRVQMCLADARQKALDEFDEIISQCRYSLAEIREFAATHHRLRGGLVRYRRVPGTAGTAAHFVRHVDSMMCRRHRRP